VGWGERGEGKAYIAFASLNTDIVGSNPARGIDISQRLIVMGNGLWLLLLLLLLLLYCRYKPVMVLNFSVIS
jgi:hypothetical protein